MEAEAIFKLITQMLAASLVTIRLFFSTLLFGLPLGLIVCFGRMSKVTIVRRLVQFYLLIMRGTPLLLQLFFFYYAPFYLFGITFNRNTAAVLAFSINYAAYFAEIYRGGIESMPVGQYEAASVLGFTRVQTFIKIILPQVIKRILPSLGNEFMTLVKDTALAQVIGVAEIFQLASAATSRIFSTVPLLIAGVFYLIMNTVVEKTFTSLEKKMHYYS